MDRTKTCLRWINLGSTDTTKTGRSTVDKWNLSSSHGSGKTRFKERLEKFMDGEGRCVIH